MTTTTASTETIEMVRRAIASQTPARAAQFRCYLTDEMTQARAMNIIRQLSGTVASTETGDLPRERNTATTTASSHRSNDASEAQARYATDLLRTRVAPGERVTGSVKTAAEVLALFEASGVMSRDMARNVIDSYKDRPRIVVAAPVVPKAAKPAPVVLEAGMYRVGDDWFKVQKSRQSGRMYAKRLVVHSPGQASFEYDSGAIRGITPDHRVTLEEAQQFGHAYGVCCNCGALLTDPKSVAAGIGPICAGRV